MLSILEAPFPEVVEAEEFEIVLGARQAASALFIATVILVVFCAASYLGGKASSLHSTLSVPPPPAVQPVILPAETIAPAPVAPDPEPPLFADPSPETVYLQIGSVDKGIALLLTEGLRKRGFLGFAAPGPTPKTFRVLIGPLADAEAFRHTREAIDQIGLSAFARRYAR